jgi:GNAT superfamily N-acetyltransferase
MSGPESESGGKGEHGDLGSHEYVVRRATVADIPVLAAQRRAMFTAMGTLSADDAASGDALEAATRRYLARAMPAGLFVAWVAEIARTRQIVAGGGVQFRELLPLPGWRPTPTEGAGAHEYPSPAECASAASAGPFTLPDCATEALVLSMWCDPDHRRRGLATRIMACVVGLCRDRRVFRISLHATPMGRSVYERLGFKPTNEMRLVLG